MKISYVYSSTLLLTVMCFSVYGQPGISEMNTAGGTIKGWYPSFSSFLLILAACFGLVGGFKIYQQLQQGKGDMDRSLTRWILAAIFMGLLGGTMKAMFL